jgi:hypothetical protein
VKARGPGPKAIQVVIAAREPMIPSPSRYYVKRTHRGVPAGKSPSGPTPPATA